MSELNRWVVAISLLCCGAVGLSVSARQQKVNPDAQLLQDFKQRVDKYMELHNRAEKKGPALKETDDPAKIKASQVFRRLMYPEIKGPDGAETKKVIKEDAPAAITLKVNAKYPENAPLPTVPPNLLANLPQLPKDLEYRIVHRDLILRDVHANLIVDFIPKAIR
jgi:hypothetical protein